MIRQKNLLFVILFSVVGLSCGIWNVNDPEKADSMADSKIDSSIPFETKEPEIYQCEIVVTTFGNVENLERIIRAARNGDKIRYDYPKGLTFLQLGEGEIYLINNGAKIFVQSSNNPAEQSEKNGTLKEFLTLGWLNSRREAKFENLGQENGRTRYRIVVDESASSESIITVENSLNFPVKQEFFVINGDQKTRTSSVELRNLQLNTDESLFQIPKEFKLVSVGEYQTAARRSKR